MTSVLRYLTGFFSADTLQPGLFQKNDGTVWVRNPNGSETPIVGDAVTDEVITITHGGAEPPSLPILAADVDAQTFTVAGDQTVAVGLLAKVTSGAGFTVQGSTGNDGNYIPASATYDSGTDRTVITVNTNAGQSVADGTADGTIQLGIVYVAEITIPANGAVEWVLVDTTVEWDSGFYVLIGDEDEPGGFGEGVTIDPTGGLNAGTVDRWQWPVNTLDAASSSPIVLVGSYRGITFYPDGATIKVIGVEAPGGSEGTTTVVVHHHFTEPVTPTRIPAA